MSDSFNDWLNSTTTTAGQVYTITSPISATGGTYTYDYSSINWTSVNQDLNGNELQVNGNANIEGDLKVQGKSIVDSLDRIEERLAILRPNEELEEKWENLRGLRKAYMELEAEILEKEKIWATLKK